MSTTCSPRPVDLLVKEQVAAHTRGRNWALFWEYPRRECGNARCAVVHRLTFTALRRRPDELFEPCHLDGRRRDGHAFSHGKTPKWSVHVHAFDRETEGGIDSHEALTALAARRGSVPITDIALHDVSLEDVVRYMKLIHVQLRNPRFPELDIVGRGDHPKQD